MICSTSVGGGPSGDPWINELHYDNDSTDTGEFVEIAGPAGLDLSGWQVQGYNGSDGGTYGTTANLSGVIPDQGGCMGTLAFDFIPMQNGSPDGLALIDDTGTVIEFICYEGSFAATDGPAGGTMSVDIGVAESGSTPIGDSLQLAGTGAASADFTWQQEAPETPGLPNNNQTLDGCGGCTVDADCDDGLYCNGAETCDAGTCLAGMAPICDDGVGCTDDLCNESTDSCDNVANDTNCDNGLYCDGMEPCDPVLDCLAGTAVNCSDGVACTDDSCNESTDACDNVANDGSCDDGDPCTIDTCDLVVGCTNVPVDCDDGNACTTDTCDPGTGSCVNDPIVPCCGDTFCDAGEDQCDCPGDCGTPPATEADCTDGIDEDCDSRTDCDDADCGGDPACATGTACGNKLCEGSGEDCFSCPSDCRCAGRNCSNACCGDGICSGENANNCPVDCGG